MSVTDQLAAAVLLTAGLALLAAAVWMSTLQPGPAAAAGPGARDGSNLAGDVEAWLRAEGY